MRVNKRSRLRVNDLSRAEDMDRIVAAFAGSPVLVIAIAVALALEPGRARADADEGAPARTEATSAFEVPLRPGEAPPWWELEVSALALAPLERSTLCPADVACLFNAGVGLDAGLTVRAPDGVGWGIEYAVWILDGAGVYEVTLVNLLLGHFRYVFDASSRVQPFLDVRAGALLLGDAGSVATAGALVGVGVGIHVEVTSAFALVVDAELSALGVAPFRTRGPVSRADPVGIGVTVELGLGAMVRFGQGLRR